MVNIGIVTILLAGASPGAVAASLACTPVRGEVTITPTAPMQGIAPGDIQEVEGVWTGSELLLWSAWTQRYTQFAERDGLFAYSPQHDAWRSLRAADLPHLRRPSFVWVNGRAVLWGGVDRSASQVTNLGAIINPASGTVVRTSMRNAPLARQYHLATVVGRQMFVFGGGGAGGVNGWSCDGALFDPIANAWSPVAAPPAELCPDVPNLRLIAGNGDRVAMVTQRFAQRTLVRAAIYDVPNARWTLGPEFDPGHATHFLYAPAFGPDGAVYVVASVDEPRGAVLFRIDPNDGHFDALGPVCAAGPIFRAGDRLRIAGPGIACEVDPARRSCVLPMRAVGFASPAMQPLIIPTDDGLISWGQTRGNVVRFGPEVAAPTSGPNVHGGVIADLPGHCGGAMVPPWAAGGGVAPGKNVDLLIRRGTRNTDPHVVAQVHTDDDGLFQTQLGEGTYCVVPTSQRAVKPMLPKGTAPDLRKCLEEANAKCLQTFTVTGRSTPTPVTIEVPHPCFGPCFRGSPPP